MDDGRQWARLRHLWGDVLAVGHDASAERSLLLVQVNEQLVLAALKADAFVESTRSELDDLARTAHHDELTGTPNRALLLDRMQRAIAQARRNDTGFALLFLDLDHFKHINDTRGHATGDEVLRQVARRLESAVRGTDTVSRYGGDEFLVLLAETARPEDAGSIADKVLAALAEPLTIEGNELLVSASVGISLYPNDGTEAVGLIAKADEAMYAAKRQGPGRHVFYRTPGRHPHERKHPVGDVGGETLERELLPTLNQQQLAFLSAVAQELGAPLTPLRSAAELIDQASGDEARLRQLQAHILQHVARMERLVGDLSQAAHVNFR